MVGLSNSLPAFSVPFSDSAAPPQVGGQRGGRTRHPSRHADEDGRARLCAIPRAVRPHGSCLRPRLHRVRVSGLVMAYSDCRALKRARGTT